VSVLFYLYFSGKRHVTFWCLISWWALVVLEACSCNAVFGPELRVRTNAGLKYASRLKCFIDKDANNWRRNVTPRDMIAECRNNRTVVAMATVQHLHYNTQSIEAKTNNESVPGGGCIEGPTRYPSRYRNCNNTVRQRRQQQCDGNQLRASWNHRLRSAMPSTPVGFDRWLLYWETLFLDLCSTVYSRLHSTQPPALTYCFGRRDVSVNWNWN